MPPARARGAPARTPSFLAGWRTRGGAARDDRDAAVAIQLPVIRYTPPSIVTTYSSPATGIVDYGPTSKVAAATLVSPVKTLSGWVHGSAWR
jgi:hypothetical protein